MVVLASGEILAADRSEPLAGCSLAARDFGEGARICRDGFGYRPAIDELALAAAGDQPGFAQNLEVVRDGCGGHAAHGDDLAAGHVAAGRDGLKDPEAGLVGQSFGYFFDLGTIHEPIGSVAESDIYRQRRLYFPG